MLAEFVDRILSLSTPNIHSTSDGIERIDKPLQVIVPPSAREVQCSTLQGFVDLYKCGLDSAPIASELLAHIASPTEVHMLSRKADLYGRRHTWVMAEHPPAVNAFRFGQWMDPETFIISAQSSFQRVKVEGTDPGTMAQDLDYVLGIASNISAEAVQSQSDDGVAQRVATRYGVVLKAETLLRPLVNLAPYRTFAEIDQVLSRFVFRAHLQNNSISLALFEAEGGRWRIDAVEAIRQWLEPKLAGVPVIR